MQFLNVTYYIGYIENKIFPKSVQVIDSSSSICVHLIDSESNRIKLAILNK